MEYVMQSGQPIVPDKKLAAVCGLFCPSCSLFIASMEDPARLRGISERFGIPPEELECHGCRSDKRGFYCRQHCKMAECAAQRGLDFCGECEEFPCPDLKTFQAQMPHRLELWESQRRICEVGYEMWYLEMIEHYSCQECNTVNSAYDAACRACGATPGSPFVKLHGDEISQAPTGLKP
jgi:hypothetical protein